jgi:hypothetical protein
MKFIKKDIDSKKSMVYNDSKDEELVKIGLFKRGSNL